MALSTDLNNQLINQGDIIGDVGFFQIDIVNDTLVFSLKHKFKYVLVLSQDCDLQWHFKTDTSKILSVLVSPMHEYKEFIYGLHLKGVDLSARNFPSQTNKTENKMLKNNQLPRYHFFDFEKTELGIDNLVIDFKIYYSVSVDYLVYLKNTNFVYSVPPLYREQISQRFAYYLSRIGLLE